MIPHAQLPAFRVLACRGLAVVALMLAAMGVRIGAQTDAAAGDNAAGKRPNVLFILTDDQRWDALGCAGHPHL